jgi:anion-transporting  ArsA/GET3 family ATPase
LKDRTSNSSLRHSTRSKNPARLYLITGKGGVGKTTMAMALTKHLESQGVKVLYNSFDQPVNQELIRELNIPHMELDLLTSTKKYIAKKLGNETIASWILKTPFFKSLFNMLPGLGHMIFFGHLINMLQEDEELTLVLDSPSSGHAITMLEAGPNFKEMFKTGIIVDDILKMDNFLSTPQVLKSIILSLPTEMALQEAQDLKGEIHRLLNQDVAIVVNDLLSLCPELEGIPKEELPEFLEKKISLEKEVLDKQANSFEALFPHFSHQSRAAIIRHLSQVIEVVK